MLFEGYTSGTGKDLRDGLLPTGDLGHLDGRRTALCGRSRGRHDRIRRRETSSPVAVENLLSGLPQVREVAVVGVGGSRVRPAPPPRTSCCYPVRASIRERGYASTSGNTLAPFLRTPARWSSSPNFPANATGKVVTPRAPASHMTAQALPTARSLQQQQSSPTGKRGFRWGDGLLLTATVRRLPCPPTGPLACERVEIALSRGRPDHLSRRPNPRCCCWNWQDPFDGDLLWEPPGGGNRPGRVTVRHGPAGELVEETGLDPAADHRPPTAGGPGLQVETASGTSAPNRSTLARLPGAGARN